MLQAAFVFGCMLRHGLWNPYQSGVYMTTAVVVGMADICVVFFMEPYRGIMRRGFLTEFSKVFKQVFLIGVLESLFLFLSRHGEQFSRIAFTWFLVFALVLLCAVRCMWKLYLIRHKRLFYAPSQMLLIVKKEDAELILETLRLNSYQEFSVAAIAYAGSRPAEGETIRNIPVLCSVEDLPAYIQTKWVDSIFVHVQDRSLVPREILEKCIAMGITIHSCLEDLTGWSGNQFINRMGGYMVLTTGVRLISVKQQLIKRVLDILGGLTGVVLTGILCIFLAPAIFLSSPGPIFFSQTRIGKNGRKFKIYKFRSMYMDAEKRKQELLARNEMQGLMFKMEDDPRIIGSGPDGTRHGIGWFIRKTSLDEFPQFWNVLKGDMSLVGTRPPTEDEWEKYRFYHRARLAVKPGLTGMWQVSGRSDITDFEEVVKLDMAYVKNWNIGMDIRILIKTVLVVLTGAGSR